MCVCVRACVRACVRVCVRACVLGRAYVYVCVQGILLFFSSVSLRTLFSFSGTVSTFCGGFCSLCNSALHSTTAPLCYTSSRHFRLLSLSPQIRLRLSPEKKVAHDVAASIATSPDPVRQTAHNVITRSPVLRPLSLSSVSHF